MFGLFFDSKSEMEQVDMNDLPENWKPFYSVVIKRLRETGATNVIQLIDPASRKLHANSAGE